MGFSDFLGTHEFTLCSGLKCKIKELSGKQFRILSKKVKGETHQDRLNNVLASVIQEIGGTIVHSMGAEAKKELVEGLFSNDRKHILVELRQFSLDFDPDFNFEYEFEYNNEVLKKELKADLSSNDGHFPVKPMATPFAALYTEAQKWVNVILPKSKVKIKFCPLDGKGEKIAASTKDPDTNLMFTMRRCQYFNDKGVWISLDPERLGQKDYSFLYHTFLNTEGSVDVEMKFKHPKADELGLVGADAFVVVNLLEVESFFFPKEQGDL
jgi:hypothetical protein